MQKISYFIRSLIRILKIEFLIIISSKLIPYLRRAIPQHTLYPKPSIRNVVRDQIKFSLNISDYMQWHVFTSEKDFSWRIAYKELLLATSNEYVIFDIGANIGAFSLILLRRIIVKIIQFMHSNQIILFLIYLKIIYL